MNTDEARKRFQERHPIPQWVSYDKGVNRYFIKEAYSDELTDGQNLLFGAFVNQWIGYQQATKESEAEIDRLLDSDRIEILVKDNDGFMSITKLSELDALKEADR